MRTARRIKPYSSGDREWGRWVPLPPLTSNGDLPLGVHRASLQEVLDRFGTGSRQRMAVAERLERVYRLAHATGHLARFVVFGSFVTDKPEPHDVDVLLVMDDAFDAGTLPSPHYSRTRLANNAGLLEALMAGRSARIRRWWCSSTPRSLCPRPVRHLPAGKQVPLKAERVMDQVSPDSSRRIRE